jgi:IstB-like ATP binding protein
VFTAVHEAFWAAARAKHGDAEGTKTLIDLLLTHRKLPAAAVIAGMRAALAAGSVSVDVVVIEARKHLAAGGAAQHVGGHTARTPRPATGRPVAGPVGGRLRPTAVPAGRRRPGSSPRSRTTGAAAAPRDELTDTAADAAIEAACRILRLPTIRARHAEIAAAATRQHAGYKSFLVELLSIECDDRETRRKARLVRDAGFPRTKRLEDFDYTANPNVPPALIHTLARCAWVATGQPLCLIGDSGRG